MSHKVENARENLLAGGREALLSGGYDSLNIKALAVRCGMASGTFYQYFHSKDDLVMQIVYENCRMISENIRKIHANDWGLRRKLEYVYEQFRSFQKIYKAMRIGLLRLSDDYEKMRGKIMEEINASVQELLEDEIRRGGLRLQAEPSMAAYLLTHFLFSVGRDADPGFDVIWQCMNFSDPDGEIQNNKQKNTDLQKKLEDSQKLFRTAANSANLVVWEYDPSDRRITMSFDSDFTKYVCGVRGFPQVLENGPEKQAAVIYEKDRPALLEMYRQIDDGAETAECKFGFDWEGAPSYRHARATAVTDTRTHHRSAVCISTDITVECRMQELYEKELKYLHQTNDTTLTSKGHHDLTDGTILEYAIPGRPDIHVPADMTYDQMLSSSLCVMIQEEDRERLADIANRDTLIRKYREGEHHFTFRFRRSRHGQAPGWAELQFNTFLSPSNGHIECFVYTYDVTEQELKNKIISKLIDFGYENLGFIYPDTLAVTAFILNEPEIGQKRVDNLNYDGMLRHVLSKKQTLEGQDATFKALCMESLAEHLSADGRYLYSFSVRGGDGKTTRKQFAFSWLDQAHDTVFFAMSDITVQYQNTQQQIQELSAAKLAAVQANEAKSSFLSSMSHDLRTPLNGILGFTSIALKEPDPAMKQEYLEKIKLSGNLLLSLVNDTLDLSRIESGKMRLEPEEIDSRSFLQSVLAAISPVAEQKKIRLITNVEEYPCELIYIDRLKLQKVILNLLSNAIKYTPEGGTVRFKADNEVTSGSSMTRRITVEDNGIGISPEFLPKLFEPFSQELRPEAANVQGTGLGLSIVKKIVDLMGGTIQVHSEINKGTAFIVELPIQCRVLESRRKAKAKCAEMNLSGRHVLLVEDNYLNAEIAMLLLKDKNVEVTLAKNGESGVGCFQASNPGYFDAILMDIRMPVMDGYEATKRIRTSGRPDGQSIPIIAMSAEAFEEDRRRALDAGMNDYLTKPINPEKLYASLTQAFAD